MKKLYSLILSAAVAVSAVALQQVGSVQATMHRNSLPQKVANSGLTVKSVEKRATFQAVEMPAPFALKKAANAQGAVLTPTAGTKAARVNAEKVSASKLNGQESAINKLMKANDLESEEWESMGTGTMRDFIVAGMWGLNDYATFDVEIEESATTPGLYRIAEPYKNYEIIAGLAAAGFGYNADLVTPMYIAVEGNNFVFLDFQPGIYDTDGTYIVSSMLGANYPNFSVSTIAQAYPDGVGIYDNGYLTYPATVNMDNEAYYNIFVEMSDDPDGLYAGNKDGEFAITFPGAQEPEQIDVTEVLGEYNIDYVVELQNGSPYSGTMEVTAGGANGTVVLKFPFINGGSTLIWNVTGTYDPTTKKITISADQPTGFTGATCSFRHWDNGWSDITEITATFTGSAIVFDEDDAMGLAVDGKENSYYTLFDTIEMTKVGGGDEPNDPVTPGDVDVTEVLGDYELYYYVGFATEDGGGDYFNEMTVTAGATNGTVVFNIPFVNGTSTLTWNVTGTYDPTTKIITISADQPTGFTGATCCLRHWNGTGWTNVSEIVANFTGNAIVFDPIDAMGLQAASGSFYTVFYSIEMTKIVDDPNADPNEGWTTVGNATFVDPWVAPLFVEDQTLIPWQVELQQNDADEYLYRLVDPYKGNCPFAEYNESTAKHGYIQFNVSDPDHVSFDVVEAGFAMAELSISKMYCYNSLGMYSYYFGYSPAEIVSILGEDAMPYTTFKDGVVTLGSKYLTNQSGTTSLVYDACFGVQGEIDGGYGWTDADGNAADMSGSITFPATEGINNVNVESNNAPVEYFNLQGMKVNAPAAGTVVIRRQGKDVKKVIM